jgi:hypothetical protein
LLARFRYTRAKRRRRRVFSERTVGNGRGPKGKDVEKQPVDGDGKE